MSTIILNNQGLEAIQISDDGAARLLTKELQGVRCERCNFSGIKFDSCDLKEAVFADSILECAQFQGCNLSEARFTRCYMKFASVESCDMSMLHTSDSDLRHSQISNAAADGLSLEDCNLQDSAWIKLDFYWCRFVRLNGLRTKISEATFAGLYMQESSWPKAVWEHVNFVDDKGGRKGRIIGCDFVSARFTAVKVGGQEVSSTELPNVLR